MHDDGGVDRGGVDRSTERSFTINVIPVNDAPTLDANIPVDILEDAGATIVTLEGIGPGPANESDQVLTVDVEHNNNALLEALNLAGPEESRALTVTPLPNTNGTATITVTITDDGGRDNGGVDSVTRPILVRVLPVNDAPSFVADALPNVGVDSGPIELTGWITEFEPGQPGALDEITQTVAEYIVTDISNPDLFDTLPAVSNSGTLSYTPAAGRSGTSTFSLRVRDTGGTTNGGIDTSVASTFVIGVTPDCACLWDNGGWDGVTGQTSERDTSIPEETRTADDFTLKAGYIHRIDEIRVQMITNSQESWQPLMAELTLYEDCNGCPGEAIDCGFFENPDVREIQPLSDGFRLVEFTFNTGERLDPETNETIPGLWLRGGRTYWASPVGIGDGTFEDSTFWATAGDNIISSIPKTQAGPYKIDDWARVDGLNVDCRNMSFEVCGESCELIRDADRQYATDTASLVDTTAFPDCRIADDFALSTKQDGLLCFLSAIVFTNCDPCRAKLELHGSDCGEITIDRLDIGFASKCVQLSDEGAINYQEGSQRFALTAYRVEWHDIDLPLDRGQRYFASMHVQGTGSFNERGLFALSMPCGTACAIALSPSQAICPAIGIDEWTDLTSDVAMCVAIRPSSPDGAEDADENGATDACPADFNGDGVDDVADLLRFLDAWFAGC